MKKLTVLFVSIAAVYGSDITKANEAPKPPNQEWSFKKVTGTFDRAALQRGFQVYKEVCAACHSLNKVRFGKLVDIGFNEAAAKAIARGYDMPTIDDEGNPTQKNVLIENGILRGYMFDELNARLMGTTSTGNGRRESYAATPMPRMTNTYMANGSCTHEEIIASVKNGLYAESFEGGQVDITSGQFVFNASNAWVIKNGKLAYPVKGCALVGNGPECLKYVSMVGNNQALDNGIGVCGKNGQSVPVGVGQPTLRIDSGLIVGGAS